MKRRTFRAEREFGLLVGAVFSLLGAWWFYRGKFATAAYVVTIAGVGWDPLQRRAVSRESFWHPYPARDRRHYEKMF